MLGSILYAAFGLKPVLYASVGCFFATALFECFIRLDYKRADSHKGTLSILKQDFTESMQFIAKTQPGILKMLLLTALSRFFVMGITTVGFPYIVRSILNLNAKYYGAAESALAAAAILGSIAAGLLIGKLKNCDLHLLITALGAFMIPSGAAFLLPVSTVVKYAINIFAFCGMQAAISIFSIFAVSVIQQKTPNHLIGKVMAYTSAVTMCAQPIGQMVYGFLFDGFSGAVYFVLIPSGVIVCVIGLLAKNFFRALEQQEA